MIRIATITLLASAFLTGAALADHADILVALDGSGQLVTGTAELDEGHYTIGKRVFGFHPAGPFSGVFATTDPGYNAVAAEELPAGYSPLPGGEDLLFDIAVDTIDGVSANLWYWDGADDDLDGDYYDDVDWTPAPTGYNFEFDLLGALSAVADGSDSTVPGFVIKGTGQDGSLHQHLNMYLDDGDGDDATSVDQGFYLVGINLWMDDPQVTASETLYFVPAVGEHTPVQHRDGAVAWTTNHLAPEPATLAALAAGAGVLLRRRGR